MRVLPFSGVLYTPLNPDLKLEIKNPPQTAITSQIENTKICILKTTAIYFFFFNFKIYFILNVFNENVKTKIEQMTKTVWPYAN